MKATFTNSIWLDLLGAQVRIGGGRYRGRYLEAGEGEPLILLHGHGGHLEAFCRNVAAYATRFHVFALDACWHGLGPQPEFDPELLPVFVDHVLDFMDFQGLASAHVEGQSMGGWTALRLAHDHPGRVGRLVLTTPQGFAVDVAPGLLVGLPEPSGRPPVHGHYPYLDEPTFENTKERMVGLCADPSALSDELIEIRRRFFAAPATNASLRQVALNYLGPPTNPSRHHLLDEDDLRRIQVPTLVYWGERNVVPPPYGERVAELLPEAWFHCEPGVGHWAQYESAEVHNREVLRFLTADDR
ncbi:MAG: alpha/beta fold hydrolase [Nocardioides sp.]|uniref:alpha/beta fold hydrolase n=1 Tax=Nocardioides sp. TaxID=35761 RepID=UPI0039E49EA4